MENEEKKQGDEVGVQGTSVSMVETIKKSISNIQVHLMLVLWCETSKFTSIVCLRVLLFYFNKCSLLVETANRFLHNLIKSRIQAAASVLHTSQIIECFSKAQKGSAIT